MKVYKVECPSCGKSVDRPVDDGFAECTYCGSKLYIETSIKAKLVNDKKQYVDPELFDFFNELLMKIKSCGYEERFSSSKDYGWNIYIHYPNVPSVSLPNNSFQKNSYQEIETGFKQGNTVMYIKPGNILLDDSKVSFRDDYPYSVEEQRKCFYSLSVGTREIMRKYIYYAFKASFYSEFLYDYVEISKLKEKYETDPTYVMGKNDLPKNEVNHELERLARIMMGIKAEVRKDEALLEEKKNNNADPVVYTKTK